LRNVASRLVGQIIANAGVPNAATYSRTSEKPSARTAFRHGERAPDYVQPVDTRETKCPDISEESKSSISFSYPMLSRRYRLAASVIGRRSENRAADWGAGPGRERALGEIRTLFQGLFMGSQSRLAAITHHCSSRELSVTVGKVWARCGRGTVPNGLVPRLE